MATHIPVCKYVSRPYDTILFWYLNNVKDNIITASKSSSVYASVYKEVNSRNSVRQRVLDPNRQKWKSKRKQNFSFALTVLFPLKKLLRNTQTFRCWPNVWMFLSIVLIFYENCSTHYDIIPVSISKNRSSSYHSLDIFDCI